MYLWPFLLRPVACSLAHTARVLGNWRRRRRRQAEVPSGCHGARAGAVPTALARRERREWRIDAIPGRLDGHYLDVATRGRGHRHSDFAGIFCGAAARAVACCYGNHSHTKIAPLVTKITYIKMDPLNPIRNGFVNPSPMDSHFRVAWG